MNSQIPDTCDMVNPAAHEKLPESPMIYLASEGTCNGARALFDFWFLDFSNVLTSRLINRFGVVKQMKGNTGQNRLMNFIIIKQKYGRKYAININRLVTAHKNSPVFLYSRPYSIDQLFECYSMKFFTSGKYF